MTNKKTHKFSLNTGGYITWMGHKGSNKKPGILFCCGYGSDMQGKKCYYLLEWGEKNQQSVIVFDYQGCGLSSGSFEEGSIGLWFDNTKQIFDHVTSGPQIIIGSSMGGWIAMMMMRERFERIKAAILIAPAPDFPEKLILPMLNDQQKKQLKEEGKITQETGLILTHHLIEESKSHHLMQGKKIIFDKKLRILHGIKDDVVPWSYGLDIFNIIDSPDASFTLVKDGDHNLSSPSDLNLLGTMIAGLVEEDY